MEVVKGVVGLSEGCIKVVRGELWNHFCSMMKFLPESCQHKMTNQRFSRYLKGGHNLLKGCHKVPIGLS